MQMNCAWSEYLKVLPLWMRDQVDKYGGENLQELRLRINKPPVLVMNNLTMEFDRVVTEDDIRYLVNIASKYSPWSANSITRGYITIAGGHRIGVCGEAIVRNGVVEGIRKINALCIRVARDFPGISSAIQTEGESILIVGTPGVGKTTFLRDLIRNYSLYGSKSVGVVDERGEIFPMNNGSCCFDTGPKTDVLSWTNKQSGIEMLLRSMNPGVIAVDEISSAEDCATLLRAGWSGVYLFATAHAAGKEDLYRRSTYKPLMKTMLFDKIITIFSDKSWKIERL